MGFELAEAYASKGFDVYLISGPVHLETKSQRITRIDVESALEMQEECLKYFPECNGAIMAAAVADFRPESFQKEKIKKSDSDELIIRLVKNPDILKQLGEIKKERQFLVGFSLETHNEEVFAKQKMISKNADMMVLNSLNDEGAGFGFDTNKVTIFFKNQQEPTRYSLMSKSQLSEEIVRLTLNLYF